MLSASIPTSGAPLHVDLVDDKPFQDLETDFPDIREFSFVSPLSTCGLIRSEPFLQIIQPDDTRLVQSADFPQVIQPAEADIPGDKVSLARFARFSPADCYQ